MEFRTSKTFFIKKKITTNHLSESFCTKFIYKIDSKVFESLVWSQNILNFSAWFVIDINEEDCVRKFEWLAAQSVNAAKSKPLKMLRVLTEKLPSQIIWPQLAAIHVSFVLDSDFKKWEDICLSQ